MLITAVEAYLNLRHALGFDLRHAGSILRRFARFASERGESHVVAKTAIGWSSLALSVGERDRRLKSLIRFARHVRVEDPRHEVPPDGVYGRHRRRHVPFIFSGPDVGRLLQKASCLGPAGSLRPHTYTTLLGLLAVTGLRVSEALHLTLGDVTEEGLVIRETKFRKSRLVPLHATALEKLECYLAQRSKLVLADDHVFVSPRGRALCYEGVRRVFHSLVQAAGIRCEPNGRVPQIHSLRHTFAVRALETCPRNREEIGQHLLALSTYLGHAHVADTYWYLEATPQLLGDIADMWEVFVGGGGK